jgi:hypothetical protein
MGLAGVIESGGNLAEERKTKQMKIGERDKREIIFLLLGHFSLEGSRMSGLRR